MSLMTPALAGGFFITVPPITKEQTQIQAEVDPDSCDIKGLTLWVHEKCSHWEETQSTGGLRTELFP